MYENFRGRHPVLSSGERHFNSIRTRTLVLKNLDKIVFATFLLFYFLGVLKVLCISTVIICKKLGSWYSGIFTAMLRYRYFCKKHWHFYNIAILRCQSINSLTFDCVFERKSSKKSYNCACHAASHFIC